MPGFNENPDQPIEVRRLKKRPLPQPIEIDSRLDDGTLDQEIAETTTLNRTRAEQLAQAIKSGANIANGVRNKLPDAPTFDDLRKAKQKIAERLPNAPSMNDIADYLAKGAKQADDASGYLKDQLNRAGIEVTKKDALELAALVRLGPLAPKAIAVFLVKNYGIKLLKLAYYIGQDVNAARKTKSEQDQPQEELPDVPLTPRVRRLKKIRK